MQKFKNKMLIQKGFTLVELLVCLFLSVLIIALLCQTILANNRLYKGDIVRTNLNQDLKSAMVILSSTIKEAGENLAGTFPAVELKKDEETGFSEPVDFRANISFDGGEAQSKEYGFNTADFDAVLLTDRGEYPFKKGDVIWLDSEPTKDENGLVDSTSADFTIVGVKPSLYSVKYMLKAVVKEV